MAGMRCYKAPSLRLGQEFDVGTPCGLMLVGKNSMSSRPPAAWVLHRQPQAEPILVNWTEARDLHGTHLLGVFPRLIVDGLL